MWASLEDRPVAGRHGRAQLSEGYIGQLDHVRVFYWTSYLVVAGVKEVDSVLVDFVAKVGTEARSDEVEQLLSCRFSFIHFQERDLSGKNNHKLSSSSSHHHKDLLSRQPELFRELLQEDR